jgi:hypothetical protein
MLLKGQVYSCHVQAMTQPGGSYDRPEEVPIMTRRVHNVTQPPKESAKAWAAWLDYRAMPPGERSLANLIARYRSRSAAEEPPPTRRVDTLKTWSAVHNWQARLTVWESELEHARRQEALRQAEAQVRENSQLMQQVGAGSLSIAALALNQYVDARTGELLQPIPLRDVPQLMRAGAELIQLAVGSPTSIVSTQDGTQLERCLRESDPHTREVVLHGLRAALAWIERNKQGGE